MNSEKKEILEFMLEVFIDIIQLELAFFILIEAITQW